MLAQRPSFKLKTVTLSLNVITTMIAVIAAGGKGTRLASVAGDLPKALITIGKAPVIEHQILLLKKYAVTEIWLLVGHLAEQIIGYVGDGQRWGVNVRYSRENEPLGRSGALKQIASHLAEDFLFLSGDLMMDFDVQKFIDFHCQKKDAAASLLVHASDHPFDSDLVLLGRQQEIAALSLKPHQAPVSSEHLGIASVFIFSPRIFQYIPDGVKSDFEKDVLPRMLGAGEKVYGYRTEEYIKDMGTPERLEKVRREYELHAAKT